MSVNKYNPSTGTLTTLASGDRTWIGTKAQYDAQKTAGTLPNNTLIVITDDEQQTEAEQISYDNTDSGLTADNVQDAIDEVKSNFKPAVDTVANNNMNPVTSNAVYDALNDYSKEKTMILDGEYKCITFKNPNTNKSFSVGGMLVLSNNMLSLQSTFFFEGDNGEAGRNMITNLNTLGGFLTDLEWDFDWANNNPQYNIEVQAPYIGWVYGDCNECLYIDSSQPGLYIKFPHIGLIPTYNDFKTMFFRCKVRPKTT